MRLLKYSFAPILILLSSTILLAQSQVNDRAQWFVDSRFGMFIHWGVYSGAEGYWKGEKLRNDNDYAEWIYYRNRIEKDEYLTLLDRFDWDSIDPEEWVEVVPEGVEAVVPHRGSVSEILIQMVGGLRSGMSYCGAATLEELYQQAEFIRITQAGRDESGVHDVSVL